MTTLDLSSAAPSPTLAATAPAGRRPSRQPWAVLGLAVAGGLLLGWQGGWLGAVGAACAITAGLGLPWLRRQGEAGGDSAGLVALHDAEARHVEGLLAGASDALALLLAPSAKALEQRDAAQAELGHCAAALDELRQAGRAAREIGKHTRLVAFDASIEAQRHSGGGANGAVAIALETRTLAGRISEVGAQVGQVVDRLESTLLRCQQQGQVHDTTPDELRLELNLRAREALGRLQVALGGTLDNGAQLQAALPTATPGHRPPPT